MKNKFDKSNKVISFNLIEVIVVVLITGLAVSVGSGFIIYKNYEKANVIKEIDANGSLAEFVEVYNNITKSYVEEVNKKELIEAAIQGMFNYLGDDYSNYLDSEATEDLQDRLEGEYYGIGVEISNDDTANVKIVTVFNGSPADKAGLKVGDYIVKLENEDLTGAASSYVANLIKNSEKKKISLTYLRNKKEYTVNITLQTVSIPVVTTELYNNNIGYIKLSTFAANSLEQFKTGLNELNSKNIQSLIIDLRNNSGGYLDSAFDISDIFLEKDKIVYKLQDRNKNVKSYKAKTTEKTEYKIVVLINENSASASEILAAALKESYGATLVGKKSFGKGSVQEVDELDSGGMIKYTTAYWLTPNGEKISGVGINPDIVVENKDKEDTQLNKAIEAVK